MNSAFDLMFLINLRTPIVVGVVSVQSLVRIVEDEVPEVLGHREMLEADSLAEGCLLPS